MLRFSVHYNNSKKPTTMGQWMVYPCEESETIKAYAENYTAEPTSFIHNQYTLSNKSQIFLSTDEKCPIDAFKLEWQKTTDPDLSNTRNIEVNFRVSASTEMRSRIQRLFKERQLGLIYEQRDCRSRYETTLPAGKHSELTIALSTLNDIYLMEDSVKVQIVEYFAGKMNDAQKTELKSTLFHKFYDDKSLICATLISAANDPNSPFSKLPLDIIGVIIKIILNDSKKVPINKISNLEPAKISELVTFNINYIKQIKIPFTSFLSDMKRLGNIKPKTNHLIDEIQSTLNSKKKKKDKLTEVKEFTKQLANCELDNTSNGTFQKSPVISSLLKFSLLNNPQIEKNPVIPGEYRIKRGTR